MTINEVFIASAETEQKVVEQIGDDQWELMMPEKITRTPMSLMEGVHLRGAGNSCQLMAGSGGSQGFPVMAPRMASSAVMPWAAAVSR